MLGGKMMSQVPAGTAATEPATGSVCQLLFPMTAPHTVGKQPSVEEAQCGSVAARHLSAAFDQPNQQPVCWAWRMGRCRRHALHRSSFQ